MRETGPVRFRFVGDETLAGQYIAVARTQLGILKGLMRAQSLQVLSRRVALVDGTVLSLASIFGQDVIQIDVSGVLIAAEESPSPVTAVASVALLDNQLAVEYAWATLFNFALQSSTSSTPWYKQVVGAVLAPLGAALAFSFVPDGPARLVPNPTTAKTLAAGAPAQRAPSGLLATFGAHVRARRTMAARYWFGVLADLILIQVNGVIVPVSAADLLVSDPDSAGNFFVLWGLWNGPPVFDPDKPGLDTYAGILISYADLVLQAKQAPSPRLLNLDLAVADASYVGPKILGLGHALFQRTQLGNFGPLVNDFNAGLGLSTTAAVATKGYIGYRADGLPATGLVGWPFAICYGYRVDEQVSAQSQARTCTFVRQRIDAFGSFITETVPLRLVAADGTVTETAGPVAATSVVKVISGAFGPSQTVTAFATDLAFFDGAGFVKAGRYTQTATSAAVDPVTGAGTLVSGTATLVSSFADTTTALAPGFLRAAVDFDMYLPDSGVAFAHLASPAGRVTLAATFAANLYTATAERDAGFSPTRPLFPVWNDGPSWGTYDYGASPEEYDEVGLAVMGFSAASATRPQVATKSHYAPAQGVVWYRRAGPTGVFLYAAPSDAPFLADTLKYRNIANAVVGFRQIKNADGTLTTEAGWEDPSAVLARVWARVTVYVNNFGTAEMIPWIESGTRLVIVDA